MIKAYQDPSHHGNSAEYINKGTCIEPRCRERAGTRWSHLWCFRHNVERMDRINESLEKIMYNWYGLSKDESSRD